MHRLLTFHFKSGSDFCKFYFLLHRLVDVMSTTSNTTTYNTRAKTPYDMSKHGGEHLSSDYNRGVLLNGLFIRIAALLACCILPFWNQDDRREQQDRRSQAENWGFTNTNISTLCALLGIVFLVLGRPRSASQ